MFRSLIPQSYLDKFEDVNTIPEDELEGIYIRNRQVAICTNAYKDPKKYEAAYYRCKVVLCRILLRHQVYVLNGIARKFSWADLKCLSEGGLNLRNLDYFGSDFVFAASLVYFNGWFLRGFGTIEEDKGVSFTLADFLIANRYESAWLIRGLAQKYGVDVFCKPSLVEAKTSLNIAKEAGVSTTTLELSNIDNHAVLESLASDNVYEPTWSDKSYYNKLERRSDFFS